MRVMPISTQGNVAPVRNNGKQAGSDFVKKSDVAFTGWIGKITLGTKGAFLGSRHFGFVGAIGGAATGVLLGHKCDKEGEGKDKGWWHTQLHEQTDKLQSWIRPDGWRWDEIKKEIGI